MRTITAVTVAVLSITVLLLSPGGPARARTTRPAPQNAEHNLLVRQAIDRINATPAYFPEMDALKDILTEDDLPFLHHVLSTGQRRARRAVAWMLAHTGSPKSIDPLRTALAADEDFLTRGEAALTLGHLRAKQAEADLIKAMRSDPHFNVRTAAADALGLLGSQTALEAIRKAAEAENDRGVKRELDFLVRNPRYGKHFTPPLRPGQVSEGYFKGTRYLVYVPSAYNPRQPCRWLVSIHGTWGWPESYLSMAKDDAERNNLLVLAPHFDQGQYSWFGTLNLRRNKLRPDLRILDIIAELSKRLKADPKHLLLYGHSEGGEFVHRFALAHPDRVVRAAAAGCDMYVAPDPGTHFPTGTGPNPLAPDLHRMDFRALVQGPLAIILGTKDDPAHQEKTEQFMKEVHAYAARQGITSRVRFFPVEGGDHSGVSSWPVARLFLFANSPESAGGYEDGPLTLARNQGEAAQPTPAGQ